MAMVTFTPNTKIVSADVNANFAGLADATLIPSGTITAAKIAAEAWTVHVPTYANLTLGNGTVSTRYHQIGKTVFYRGKVTWGSTTSSAGVIGISLPVTGFSGQRSLGSGATLDSNPGTWYLATSFMDTAYVYLYNNATGQAVAGNYATPFTLATGDTLEWQITYEAA